MNILKHIFDNVIIITPSHLKEKIIKEISLNETMISYKIFSEKDLKKSLFFDYDINAIDYIYKQYNLKHSVAKEYIENMYFIENKNYLSQRLNQLKNIKKELLDKNLLKIDKYAKDLFKNSKIIVYGFDVITNEMKLILSKLDVEYQIIESSYSKTNPVVYHFNTLEEEVDAVCYQISKLLDSGIDINKIKIANINSDYDFTIKRYFKMYNIPILLECNETLFSLLSVKDFINNCSQSLNLSSSLEYFKRKFPDEIDIYNLLINVCNQMSKLETKDSLETLKYLIKNTKMPSKSYLNCVEKISLDNCYIEEDEYVFVLSLNQGIYPKTYKNEDFLSDKEKEELGLDTSQNLNVLSKARFKKLLNKSSKLFLSYKDKSAFSNYTKAFIINEENLVVKEYSKMVEVSFSKQVDCLNLAKLLDKIYQKSEDATAKTLLNNYQISYKEYDHSFVPFSSETIKNYMILTKKSLSYSSLNNYFMCGFRYYLYNVLSIGKPVENRSVDIGNIFHKVLEKSIEEDFDFEKIFSEECNKIDNIITLFYLNKFKTMLKDIIEINKDIFKDSKLTNVLTEKKITIEYQKPIPITFKGFVDKILYTKENDKTYVAIIDYKTGDPDIDVSKVDYGLSMQLPFYLYLMKHTSEFENLEVCGFYLQKLLPKQPPADVDYYQHLKTSIAFQGYSNSSKAILSMLDPHYENSSMIKSMRVKKDGDFYSYVKVLSSDEMDDIANKVENKIYEALNDICKCKFNINPKILGRKNQSCSFCEFKDCCFVTHNDYMYLDGLSEMESDEDGD